MSRIYTILHVDDDRSFVETAAAYLERTDDRLRVVTETCPTDALARFDPEAFDCVVSDYQMPEMDGLELLDGVREEDQDFPFVLFTGKGSEDIASRAITAGVTGYLQKKSGTEQYELLANRITNAVTQYRTAREHERVHQALETATEGIAILDADGRYVYLNRAYADLYGRDSEEMIADHWTSVHPEGEVEWFREQILPTLDSAGTWSGRSRGLTADGTPLVEELSLAKLDDGGQVWCVRDVTDRVERERELQRERDRFSALFENVAVPIAYYEFEGEHPIAKEVNPAFEQTFCSGGETAVGRKLDEVVVPEEYVEEGKTINERARDGEIVDTEVVRQSNDGRRVFNLLSVPLSPGESGERGFTVYTDLTELKERERKLERYETVVEASGDPVYTLDADDRFTFVNDALVRTTGYSLEELVGEHVSVVMDPDDVQRGERLIRELLSSSDGRDTFEMDLVTADGERIPCENQVALLPFDEEYRGTVGVLRDISDRKERERELRRQKDRLEEFAGIVSHDMRSPLNLAQARLELAREECDSPHLSDVVDAHDRMETLIEETLTLARQGETVGEREAIDVRDRIERWWTRIETGDAELQVADEMLVWGDPGRLRHVFVNLFRNAIDHGGEDVTVRVGGIDDEGFYVADDGVGIPPDRRDEVFDVGYTTDRLGTGFGLTIVRDIVEAHGWDIAVTESADGGARFDITGVDVEAEPSHH